MGKAALGKGMKDLLTKNVGMPETKKDESRTEDQILEELKVNINRYRAQGFDVEDLKELEKSKVEDITNGIEAYRKGVKVLNTVQTILRSLEGYGYSKEIEEISEKMAFPSKAAEVLSEVEELKDRARTEHNFNKPRQGKNASKLSESLKEKSEILNRKTEPEDESDIEIDEDLLDDMLGDLDEIGESFDLDIEDDPLLSKILDWEAMGYFVDGLKAAVTDDREKAVKDIEQFEKDISKMEPVKKRFNEMDMTGFNQEAKEIVLKFQYPHLAKEIENELGRIDTIKKKASELDIQPEPEEEPRDDPEVVVKDEPEAAPKPEPEEEEQSPAPVEDISKESKPENEVQAVSEYDDNSPDELMEMAKDAYKNGNLELSLTLFKEIIKKDPESSKARFMIRRLSKKI